MSKSVTISTTLTRWIFQVSDSQRYLKIKLMLQSLKNSPDLQAQANSLIFEDTSGANLCRILNRSSNYSKAAMSLYEKILKKLPTALEIIQEYFQTICTFKKEDINLNLFRNMIYATLGIYLWHLLNKHNFKDLDDILKSIFDQIKTCTDDDPRVSSTLTSSLRRIDITYMTSISAFEFFKRYKRLDLYEIFKDHISY